MEHEVIFVTSNKCARKLNILRGQLGLHVKICQLPHLKEFSNNLKKEKDIGLDVKGSYDLQLDMKQSAITSLYKNARTASVIHFAFNGISGDYYAQLYKNLIRDKYPTKVVKRMYMTGLTPERFLSDYHASSEDAFNDEFYNKELALRSLDRLSSFYMTNNKLFADINFTFPGVYLYFVLLYIMKKNSGYTVYFTTDKQLSMQFKTKDAALSFMNSFDAEKFEKKTEAFTHRLSFTDEYFFRSKMLLSQYDPNTLSEALWLLYDYGLITNPVEQTSILDTEYLKVRDFLSNYSAIFNEPIPKFSVEKLSDVKGFFVTDISIEPEDPVVPSTYMEIYRYIRRYTLAFFSPAYKGILTNHYYKDGEDSIFVGTTHATTNKGGYVSFLKSIDNYTFIQETKKFKVPRLAKNRTTVYDVISYFGVRGFYAIKKLKELQFIDLDSNYNIKLKDSFYVMRIVMNQVYPDLLKTESVYNVIKKHYDVKDIFSRVHYLTYCRSLFASDAKELDLPVCLNCGNKLSLVLQKSSFLLCRDNKGCGKSYSIKYTTDSFIPTEIVVESDDDDIMEEDENNA